MGWLLLLALALGFVAVGPWIFVFAAALLLVPRIRQRVPRPHFTWKGWLVGCGAALTLLVTVMLLPDGMLRIPTVGGVLITPDYTGRQASPEPLTDEEEVQHPWMADHARYRPGPLGDLTASRTAWYGMGGCRKLTFDSTGRLVGMCLDMRGPLLRVFDAETLRPLASKRLPAAPDTDDPVRIEVCRGTQFYLDNGDRAVVVTTDNQIKAISTHDADGEPDLTVDKTWDLNEAIGEDDCLVAALPDWQGNIWWASLGGRVGVLDRVAGGVQVLELGERVTRPFSVDLTGVFLATDTALHRLALTEGGPTVTWRTAYDRGVEVKSGQVVQGSGSGPALVDGGLVALADNAEPRMRIVFVDRSTGEEVCNAGVFAGGRSSTSTQLVTTGPGVIVVNDHGHDSWTDTLFGTTPTGGVARVDHEDGECRVVWTNDVSAAKVRPILSWQTGLLYAWTKRPSVWGVPAWYLSALDVTDGRTVFEARGGTGGGVQTARAQITLSPDGAAYVGTRAGIVRVRDAIRE